MRSIMIPATAFLFSLVMSTTVSAKPCKTGCAVADHGQGRLADDELVDWLQAYQDSDETLASVALETLLYHGAQVREFVRENAWASLDSKHRQKLQTELGRIYAVVELRLVNDEGELVSRMPPTEVLVGEKTHLHVPSFLGVPSFEISGTVKRVGVAHLWARL